MTPEERRMARGVHIRPAVDGHYYDAVHAAIADRDDLLDTLAGARWRLAFQIRLARRCIRRMRREEEAVKEKDWRLANAFGAEAHAYETSLYALTMVSDTLRRARR